MARARPLDVAGRRKYNAKAQGLSAANRVTEWPTKQHGRPKPQVAKILRPLHCYPEKFCFFGNIFQCTISQVSRIPRVPRFITLAVVFAIVQLNGRKNALQIYNPENFWRQKGSKAPAMREDRVIGGLLIGVYWRPFAVNHFLVAVPPR